MAATSVGNTPYILKTLWPQERIESEVYDDNPLLAMIPKSEEFYGENMYIALRYTDNKGRSGTFARAQANKNPHKGVRFLLTRGKDYSLFGIEHEMILAAKKDKGALVRSLDTEVSSALNTLTNSLAHCLFSDASGARGQIDGNDPGTGTTFSLGTKGDIVNFEVGDLIVFAATATGARRAGGTRTISAIDRDSALITVSAAIDAAVGSTDFVIIDGDDANNSATVLPTGLLGWLPTTAPAVGGGDSFFGIDRSPDPVRLAGMRIDVSALNPEEGLAAMLAKANVNGAKPSHIFRNPIDYKNILVALGTKVETEYTSVGEIGFTAIKVFGPSGEVKIYSDRSCPQGRGFTLTMKTMKLYSLGKAPMVIEADDQKILRDATADSFEGRMALYANTACDAPGWNVNETLPS
jgi:hypothetical protein